MGAIPTPIKAGDVVRNRRAIDADRYTGTSVGEQVKQSGGKERPIGLNANRVPVRRQVAPEAVEQHREIVESQQQGLATVQYGGETHFLVVRLSSETIADRGNHLPRILLG